jgi:cellulose synthase/poly-beta-1,6-N-acetylglucosamine synthase-like glycosyltransferase
LTVSVVVPTYRRPELLRRCLSGLCAQTHQPDETIVVVRQDDKPTRRVLEQSTRTGIAIVDSGEPGVLAAMRVGVACSRGDIIAFTDDDAEPRRDWLERLVSLLSAPGVGAAGGRDVIPGQTAPRRSDVGRFTRYGKLVGNHHLGEGPARDVDVLKGVNMAFRAECLGLPRRGILRGDGAEVHFELLCSRWAQRAGWRVVYDPSIEVGHLGAERIGNDRRIRPSAQAVRDAAHNFIIAASVLDRNRLPRQALYCLVLGSRDLPGLGRAAVAVVGREPEVLRRLAPSLAGFARATVRLLHRLDNPIVTCQSLREALTEAGEAA